MRWYLWLILLTSLITSAKECKAQDVGFEIINDSPQLNGHLFSCSKAIRVANYARGLGKDKCIKLLSEYLAKGGDEEKVLLLCRLIFVNPRGWERYKLGGPDPLPSEAAAEKFRSFPIAISEEVPFLVVKGYCLIGKHESATNCLKRCEGFSLRSAEYSSDGHDKAARLLTQSKQFQSLYNGPEREEMIGLIMAQAAAIDRQSK